MTRVYENREFDTDDTIALRKKINKNEDDREEAIRAYDKIEKKLIAEYVELMKKERPSYPTKEQLEGLSLIAQMVHDDTPYGDHLGYSREGDPKLPRSLNYSSQGMRINIYTRSPYMPGTAGRIWTFDENEVQALRQALSGLSLSIVCEWDHEDGHAFVVASKKV